MTPTLLGRWQIRLFLLGTVGVIISLVIGFLVKDILTPLIVLGYVFLQGVILDLPYQYIVTFRWDRDWPTSFQVVAAILEGALLWGLIQTGKLPGVPRTLPFSIFLAQYGIIWLCIFMLTQGALRVFWPDWHYQGGQWLVSRKPAHQSAYPQQRGFQPPLAVQSPLQQPSGPQPVAPRYAAPLQQPSGPQPMVQQAATPFQAPLQRFQCVCGFATDNMTGQFCPRCGRPATKA
jgi:hypothetical protein